MRPREQYQLNGTGPKGSVCLLMFGRMGQSCGIGDDIAALPAVTELCKSCNVTIYTVHPEIFARTGAVIHTMDKDLDRASDGSMFTSDWDGKNIPKYERIFKMGGGGIYDEVEYMEKAPTRFDMYADMFQITAPESFDYVEALQPQKRTDAIYTILASEAAEVWRTLSADRSIELYDGLSEDREVVWLGVRTVAFSWSELLALVYNAERVVAVASGIAHLAAALKKPTYILGGITDARTIYSMYGGELYYLQGTWKECLSPCYRNPDRGFRRNKCCGVYSKPKCMESIDISEVLTTIQGVNYAI